MRQTSPRTLSTSPLQFRLSVSCWTETLGSSEQPPAPPADGSCAPPAQPGHCTAPPNRWRGTFPHTVPAQEQKDVALSPPCLLPRHPSFSRRRDPVILSRP